MIIEVLEVSSVLSPLPGISINPRQIDTSAQHPPRGLLLLSQSTVSHALARNVGVLFSPTALEPDADVHAFRLVPTRLVWCAQYAQSTIYTILLSASSL